MSATAPAIHATALGKSYRISHRDGGARYQTLAEDLRSAFRRSRPGQSEEFWALRDVGFEVKEGEIVGIIGRNGSGKTTLLKILSRITEPTTGYADVWGRVGALLEVGTGFHPELTGRENIFLNACILGMNRREVERRFDGIVAFAEIERFLDTPVKRYSSGMYVRLAFAVAAHLDPDILLVDEVLAVGDLAFQKKCLGKMDEVARQGRTVLFVSHSLATVSAFCQRGIWIDEGRIRQDGDIASVVSAYTRWLGAHRTLDDGAVSFAEHPGRRKTFDQVVRLTQGRLLGPDGHAGSAVRSGGALRLVIGYEATRPVAGDSVHFVLVLNNDQDQRLAYLSSETQVAGGTELPVRGEVECVVPALPLAPGAYSFSVLCKVAGGWSDAVYSAVPFDVVAEAGASGLPAGSDGLMLIDHHWRRP